MNEYQQYLRERRRYRRRARILGWIIVIVGGVLLAFALWVIFAALIAWIG